MVLRRGNVVDEEAAAFDDTEFLRTFSLDLLGSEPGLYRRLIDICVQNRGGHRGYLSVAEAYALHVAHPGPIGPAKEAYFRKIYRSLDERNVEQARSLARAILAYPKVVVAIERKPVQPIPDANRGPTGGDEAPVVETVASLRPRKQWEEDGPLYDIIRHRLRLNRDVAHDFVVAATGYYQMWRHSTQMPGYFSKGLLRIHVPRTGKGYVQAWQRYADAGGTARVERMQSVDEEVAGFLFPIARSNCLMLTRGATFVGFRLSIFTNIEFSLGKTEAGESRETVRSMTGYVTGTDGGKGFTSIIYLERIELDAKTKHREEMNIYPREAVPPKVAAILENGTFLSF